MRQPSAKSCKPARLFQLRVGDWHNRSDVPAVRVVNECLADQELVVLRRLARQASRENDGYFPSKEALIAEAVGQALPPAPDKASPRRPAADYADGCLIVKHRDNRATSCLFSSLGTEAARGSTDLRHKLTEAVRSRIDHLSFEADGDTPKEKRRAAIAAWSAMVGAMVLARLVDDDGLSKEILKQTRASLPLK
jgi:TetR/AcrR family transcriptional regulator, transcriptional repressor for nem operon